MSTKQGHEQIAQFMQAQREGRSTGETMVWNPQTSKFELVPSGTEADDLPLVTREDLQAFGRRTR